MKYYMYIGGQQQGPYDESELLSHGLNASTNVWREGMTDWQLAGQVPELSYLFAAPAGQPYSPQQPSYQQPSPGYAGFPSQPMPDNYLVWAILVTLFCCLPFGIVSIVKASQVSSLYRGGDYQGAVAASESAKKWAIIGAVCGFLLGGVYAAIASNAGM